MVNRIKAWRPVTDVYKMPDVGHWPSIEVPDRIGKAILDRLGGFNWEYDLDAPVLQLIYGATTVQPSYRPNKPREPRTS